MILFAHIRSVDFCQGITAVGCALSDEIDAVLSVVPGNEVSPDEPEGSAISYKTDGIMSRLRVS